MAREMAYLTPGHPHHQWSMGHVPSVAFGLMKTIIIHCPVPCVLTFPSPAAYPSSISRGPHEDPRFDEAHHHSLSSVAAWLWHDDSLRRLNGRLGGHSV